MRIIIRFASYEVEAELFDTPTGRAIYEALPIKQNVNRWGREIYFSIPVTVALEEGARPEVELGALAYWPNMPAFCIFFGPTPVSDGDAPRAASAVNVFGRLLVTEPVRLDAVPDDENVVVEKAG
jgi:hypothetical protein